MFGEIRVEGRSAMDAFVIMPNDLFECLKAAIVHIGRGESDISETWRREFPSIGFFPSDFHESGIEKRGLESVVVKLMIAEEGTSVAVEAVRSILLAAWFILSEKEFHPALLSFAEFRFPRHRPVKFGIVTRKSEEEIFESKGDFLFGYGTWPEGIFESAQFVFLKLRHNDFEIGGHFTMILDRLEDLITERFRPPIPKKGGFPGKVEEGHRVFVTLLIVNAFGKFESISKSFVLMMAGRARNSAIFGKGFIMEEFFTKSDSLSEERIVARKERHGETATHLQGKGGVIFWEKKRGHRGEGNFVGRVGNSPDREYAF